MGRRVVEEEESLLEDSIQSPNAKLRITDLYIALYKHNMAIFLKLDIQIRIIDAIHFKNACMIPT